MRRAPVGKEFTSRNNRALACTVCRKTSYLDAPALKMRIEEAENIDYLLGHISSLVDEQWHGRDGGDGVEEALHYRIKINPRLTSTKSKVPLSLIR